MDARVDQFYVPNTGAIVGDEAVIDSSPTILIGALISGLYQIGEACPIGPRAKVLQGLTIGREATSGIGCNLLRIVPELSSVWPKSDSISAPEARLGVP